MTDNQGENGKIGGLWGSRRAPISTPEGARVLPPPAQETPVLSQTKPPASEQRQYQAFTVQERAPRLKIIGARIPSRFPAYSYLLDIIFDYDFSSAFTLVYSFMVVEVTGRNLDAVVHAIAHGSCEQITEFHPRRHDQPLGDEPFIERIEIIAAGSDRGKD